MDVFQISQTNATGDLFGAATTLTCTITSSRAQPPTGLQPHPGCTTSSKSLPNDRGKQDAPPRCASCHLLPARSRHAGPRFVRLSSFTSTRSRVDNDLHCHHWLVASVKMVRADVKKDYYADLDLKPNADPQEIKKQFRNLGKRNLDCS